MPYASESRVYHREAPVPQADPADIAEQALTVDLEALIEDYPWVRRDEVLTVDGRRFII